MKCGINKWTLRSFAVRALSFAGVALLTLNRALTPVAASDYRVPLPTVDDGQSNARPLWLGVGQSIVIDLIANAVVRSPQRDYIIGAATGQTNIVFFDASGQQIAAYDAAVTRDLNALRALREMFPGSDIHIEGVGDCVVLTGVAATPIEAQQASDMAARLAGGPEKVVNSITVRDSEQVMLKVTVAEVKRPIINQLGIDLSANLSYGTSVVNFSNSNPFTANNPSIREELPRQQGLLRFRLRLSAQHCGDGRQPFRARATTLRDAGLHDVADRRVREISQG